MVVSLGFTGSLYLQRAPNVFPKASKVFQKILSVVVVYSAGSIHHMT